MDLEQAIHILKEAQGDTARLGLASADLLLAGHSDEEREKVRTALEVAAVPHWFDEKILAALLDPPLAAEAEALAAQLRRLPVVEPFPARGPGASNVHEATRLALRARMKAESPERLRALSARAQACFAGDAAPHARIEALYHWFTAEPQAAVWECDTLAWEWDRAGRYEALLGLGVVLDELLQEGLPEGLVRGTALYHLANIRYHHQPLEVTATQARAGLEEYQRSGDDRHIAMSQDLLGNVLSDQGDLPRALDAYRAGLDIQKRLAQADPSNTTVQRNVSVFHNKVGDVLRDQGDLAGALAEFRAGFAIHERLAAQDSAHAGWQRDLSVSHEKIGDVLRDQGDLAGALAEFRAGFAIHERLAAQDSAHAGWQRDLSVSHEKIGDVLRDQGDLAGALTAYRASLTIRERLAAQDPAHAQWQTDLAEACEDVAGVLLALPDGDRAEARQLVARGLERMEALAQAHPPTPYQQQVRASLEALRKQAG
jgi:tetratricopeptide (TPR) repeat protein